MEPADPWGMQVVFSADGTSGAGASGAGGTAPSHGTGAGVPAATPAVAGRPERKHPVHLANVERFNQATILFVTVCTQDRRPVLACPPMHALLREAWSRAERWRVGRYMIMPDHVHLFCSPADRESENVKHWVAYWKGLVARALEGHGPLAPSPGGPAATPAGTGLWQRDCWDTQLRDARHYGEKWAYVAMNPVRKGLAARPEDWPYQGEVGLLQW
jgi:putative transposase